MIRGTDRAASAFIYDKNYFRVGLCRCGPARVQSKAISDNAYITLKRKYLIGSFFVF